MKNAIPYDFLSSDCPVLLARDSCHIKRLLYNIMMNVKLLDPTADVFGHALDPAALDAAFRETAPILAGTDEAGRGPLAGPVLAAAVILNPAEEYPGLGDSKKLSQAAREKAFDLIDRQALAWAWAAIEAEEVDRLNPLGASMLAMRLAVEQLEPRPGLVLVDGNQKPDLDIPLKTLVKGDSRSLSIAAASIMAKVTRDRIMLDWHCRYPHYGFDRHKGYGTAAHLKALREHGPCPAHRLSFRGVLPEEAPESRAFQWGKDD